MVGKIVILSMVVIALHIATASGTFTFNQNDYGKARVYCPKGYSFYEGTQSCYKVHTEQETWFYAEGACVHEDGHLAVINSQDEADFLVKMFPTCSRQVFVGIHRIEGSWVTVDGERLDESGFELWVKGEPNNEDGSEECGAMIPRGTLNDVPCGYKTAFICETTSRQQDEDECNGRYEGYSRYERTQSCYKVHTEEATWDDAEATCVREGGHLAVINSQDEANYLMRKFPTSFRHVFVGFHKINGLWETVQGESLSETGYERWHEGEPSNDNGCENCGAMYPEGTFNDVPCAGYKTAFICEVSQPEIN